MYDLAPHYRGQPTAVHNLHSYAQQYASANRPAPHMRQQAQQHAPQDIRRAAREEEEEMARARVHQLRRLKQKATGQGTGSGRGRGSRHFVYSTYSEGGRTFIAFEKPMFITLMLIMSIGIGVIAIDARKALHFLAHTIRKSIGAMTG